MTRVTGEHDLNVSIPADLWDQLDAISGKFAPYRKKHLVAAAIAELVQRDRTGIYAAIDYSTATYYRPMNESTGSSADGSADQEIENPLTAKQRAALDKIPRQAPRGSGSKRKSG